MKRYDRLVRHGPRQFSWFIYRITNPAMRELFLGPRNVLQWRRPFCRCSGETSSGARPSGDRSGRFKGTLLRDVVRDSRPLVARGAAPRPQHSPRRVRVIDRRLMARQAEAGRRGPKFLALSASVLFAAWLAPVAGRAAEEPLWEVGLGVGVPRLRRLSGREQLARLSGSRAVRSLQRHLPQDRSRRRSCPPLQSGVGGAQVEFQRHYSGGQRPDSQRDAGAPAHRGGGVSRWIFISGRATTPAWKWDLRMPVRSAFAIESPPEAIGWTFSPGLVLDLLDHVGYDAWKLGFLTGPLFANRRYNSYFYSVQAQYANPSRPEYQASGGYAGTEFLSALSKRFPKYWVGAFVRYDSLSRRGIRGQPAVQRDHYWTAGFGCVAASHVLSASRSSRLRPIHRRPATDAAPPQNRVRILRALHVADAAWGSLYVGFCAAAVLPPAAQSRHEGRQARHHAGLSHLRVVAFGHPQLPPRPLRPRLAARESRR